MHIDCLLDDVLTRVYDRLGTDTPHQPEKPLIKQEAKDDVIKEKPKERTNGDLPYRLLSPDEAEDRKSPIVANSEVKDQVLVKQRDDESSKATETPTPAPDKLSKSGLSKRGRRKKLSKKPWEGLFEATLKMNEGPTVWEERRSGLSRPIACCAAQSSSETMNFPSVCRNNIHLQ
jgi:hypothetical protein